MDTERFDTIVRSLSGSPSRRGIGRALAGLSLGGMLVPLLSLTGMQAKKKKKKRKGKKKTGGNPSPPLPCADGIRNGSETDVDCGGATCPRCINGLNCVRRSDCASAFCSGFGACVACATDSECTATCLCEVPPGGTTKNCYSRTKVPGTDGCASCPTGTVCLFSGSPGAACFPLCSAP